MRPLIALLCLALLTAGCGDTIIEVPNAPTPPAAPRRNTIEFRVNGNATAARIRYSNPIDGLTQTVSTLPYVVESATTETILFLSLDVTPIGYPLFIQAPFLSAQIFVNGSLFREATASDSALNTLSVNGTWRAN